MRAAVGILSLLLALAVVGLLVKKQLSSTRSMVPVLQPAASVPGAAGTSGASDAATAPAPTVRAQSQQVQQQYQQAVEGLMQPRAMPDADQ